MHAMALRVYQRASSDELSQVIVSGEAQHGIDRVCPFKEKASPGGDDLLMLQPESCQQGVPPCIYLPIGCVALFSATSKVECLALLQSKGQAPTLSLQSR